MNEPVNVQEVPRTQGSQKTSWGLMVGLSAGHMVKHFYQQAFLLLIPSVKEALLLNDVQVGIIGTVRTVGSSAMNVPAGMMADLWRSKVGLILASSLASIAVGYLLIGAFPTYWMLLLGVAVTGMGTSLWHAPAFGTLAAVYPNMRATAMAVHRMGGNIGDSISPVAMGLILGGVAFWGLEWTGLGWRAVSLVLVAPALLSALLVLVGYGSRSGASGGGMPNVGAYFRAAQGLLTNASVMGMVMLASVRAMAHGGLSIFLVLYMSEDLGFSAINVGFHVALLSLFGIPASPVMGWASDRFGRRVVIVIGLSAIALLILALLPFGSGWAFTVILALLGVFLYSVNPVMLAAAIEGADRGTEGSVAALMFTGQALFGAMAPVVAGFLREGFGMDGVFYYSGGIVAVIAIASVFLPMRRVVTEAAAP